MKHNIKAVKYNPIGIIHSPYKRIEGVPIQPSAARGIKGTIELKKEFIDGLRDLEGFSHIILVYHFHLSTGYSLNVVPFLDDQTHGVFATRAPRRPNSIGISTVKLKKIEDNLLHIENVDIIDGTPLLDIKPYVTDFDYSEKGKKGWLEKNKNQILTKKSDKRFK